MTRSTGPRTALAMFGSAPCRTSRSVGWSCRSTATATATPTTRRYHPPSVSQALDLLQNRKDSQGQPIKIDIELKGSYWTQSTVNYLRDKLKSRGMLTQQVNVHAFSFTRAAVHREGWRPEPQLCGADGWAAAKRRDSETVRQQHFHPVQTSD